jgi:hypothetical protein
MKGVLALRYLVRLQRHKEETLLSMQVAHFRLRHSRKPSLDQSQPYFVFSSYSAICSAGVPTTDKNIKAKVEQKSLHRIYIYIFCLAHAL